MVSPFGETPITDHLVAQHGWSRLVVDVPYEKLAGLVREHRQLHIDKECDHEHTGREAEQRSKW